LAVDQQQASLVVMGGMQGCSCRCLYRHQELPLLLLLRS
jgi:hypothetical protein